MRVIYLSQIKYNKFLRQIKKVCSIVIRNTEYAFTLIEQKIIIINRDADIDFDCKMIVLQHERAHCTGILDEEEADRWALKRLNTIQRKMLKRAMVL